MSTTDRYKTHSGNVYGFRFERMSDGYYEVDITSQPSYQGRATNGHSTHRLSSSRGGQRICFGDPKVVDSLSQARKWAAAWAESTDDYIRSGKRF